MVSTSTIRNPPQMGSKSGVARNIAIFIDGTWNSAGTRTPTNVRKLFDATLEGVVNGFEQLKLYVPGVGKKPIADFGTLLDKDCDVELSRHLEQEMPLGTTSLERRVVGGAIGKGTRARIKATYHYLCKNYNRKRGDQVFLFGFSRGAFAARSLAGFAGRVGLLFADKLKHVERAYEIYEKSEDPNQTELADFLEQLTGVRVVTADSDYYLPMHFLGVWDTVASLGLPSRRAWFDAHFTERLQIDVPPSVMKARHALALHELRGLFEPLLWKPSGHTDLKQVWFSGSHADVGGGYEAGQTGLSDIALRWMANEAKLCDLGLDDNATFWTEWVTNPALHHEIRGPFLATRPSARKWVVSESVEDRDSHHFHRSAVDYLMKSDTIQYEFRHRFVNAALRQVNSLALPKVVLLPLVGQEIVS